MSDTAQARYTVQGEKGRTGRLWWVFLITGTLWMILALIILRFNTASIVTIGVLVGAVILAAGINELFIGSVEKSGWRWLNWILGALFIVIGTIAMFSPADTFWAMAMLIGWFLLFKGTLDIVMAFVTKSSNEMWWLGLVVGILEILLAFWAAGGFGNKVVLLIAWAAGACLARGVTEFIMAFRLRSGGEAATPVDRTSGPRPAVA
jgi:uncharacterized membrane protein HdeD (DUF308 family)